MERKYLAQMVEWMNDPQRKPLMVWGARQVGKSYLIEELFAKRYFPGRYLRIDCSEDNEFTNYVTTNNKLSDVLDYIEINYNFKPDKDHLLFFDEAQNCLAIVQMMKYFCEKRRDIPVIVSGSLVRIKIFKESHKRGGYAKDSKFLFPVGKINQIYVYPLTFDEYLYNLNKPMFDYVLAHYKSKAPIDAEMHKKIMEVFRSYLFVGGMPEVVDLYIENQNSQIDAHRRVVTKIEEIYDDYLADMDLYQASPESIVRSRAIYGDIYKQLNKENKNFKFSLTEEHAKNRDMVNPIAWLTTARVVIQSFLLKEKVSSPLVKDEDSLTRLYLSDMGMFTYQSKLNAMTFLENKDNALSGLYYENYVATELAARRIGLFYWKGKRDSEFEFIIEVGSRVVPIDVKKGRDSLNSLKEFRSHNKEDLAIKVSSNQYGYSGENDLLRLPFYYLAFYLNDLQKGAIND